MHQSILKPSKSLYTASITKMNLSQVVHLTPKTTRTILKKKKKKHSTTILTQKECTKQKKTLTTGSIAKIMKFLKFFKIQILLVTYTIVHGMTYSQMTNWVKKKKY